MTSFMSLYGTSEHSIGWLTILLDASIKSVIVLALAAGLNLALKRSSAAFRHLVWLLAVVSCLCLPVISVTLPSWRLPVGPQVVLSAKTIPRFEGNLNATQLSSPDHRGEILRTPIPQVYPNRHTAELPDSVHGESAMAASQATGWRRMSTLWTCIGIVWVFGMFVVLLPLLAGLVGIWRIARRGQHIADGSLAELADELVGQLGIKRRVTLLRCQVEMPLTWGIIRPQVLIPADAENWSTDQQRSVLLHELAHVQRWDWLTQTVSHMCCAIYWFNPLVWVADCRMRLERERACDDHVLISGCRATDYASHLLEIARTSHTSVFAARAAVALAQSSWIEKRLRVILAPDRNRRPVTKMAVTVSVLTVACLVLLIGVIRPSEAREDEVLLQQIRETVLWSPQPPERPLTNVEREAMMKLFTKKRENVLELCEQFLGMYPDSNKRDEVWRYKIQCLLKLRRQEHANSEIEAFLEMYPNSEYALEMWSLKFRLPRHKGNYKEALAELDKLNHPATLRKVYEEKSQLYSFMEDWEKAAEYRFRAAELTLGKLAPNFTLKDINGETVSLKDFRGKVVLLDFWATWCEPCIHELPALKAIYEKHKHNSDFALISISSDVDDQAVAEFVEDNKMPWIHIRETEELGAKFNVIGIPHYTVIDKNGLICEDSLRGGAQLNAVISSLLAKAPGKPDSANITKLYKLRADLHNKRGERQQAISDYRHALRLQPDDIQLVTTLARLYEDGNSEKARAFHDEALPKLVEANQSKSGTDFGLGHTAFEFAMFYDEQGDTEKCWQAFEIAMENAPDGFLETRIKRMIGRFSTISDKSSFKKFTDTSFETEQTRRNNRAIRKLNDFAKERYETRKSYLLVEADGVISVGVILSSSGLLLVPEITADATVIRAKIADYRPAKVVARDPEARLAVLKVKDVKDLQPVEMGTVDDLKEYAPYDFAMGFGYTSRAFPIIMQFTFRGFEDQNRIGQVLETHASVHVLEIDEAGNITSLQIGSGYSNLSDAFVHYDGKLLGFCVDGEPVFKDSADSLASPKYNVLPVDQIRASLERMGVTDMIGK